MSSSRLALLSFRDVLVTPYTDLLSRPTGGKIHRGGPHWPQWASQTAARHCRDGAPVDDEPAEAEPTVVVPGPLAWGGAITTHFGHQVMDFSTRLLPTLAELPGVRFAFSMSETLRERFRDWEQTPVFFREILGWYGVSREQVELIADPTLVERLVVAPQGEQQRRPPEEWYLDLLDQHTAARLGEVEKSAGLYASRAGSPARFAGEAYLETVFERSGFRGLRPETVSIEEKVRAFAGADHIVFAAGSGVHNAQLLGRSLGDVTVLTRRAGGYMGRAVLEKRARSLRYVDAVKGEVHGLSSIGSSGRGRGLSIIDPESLLAALPIGDGWDPNEFDAAVEADVNEWVEAEQASDRWKVPGSAELIREKIREVGLGHLV
jgi:hypothetical protein